MLRIEFERRCRRWTQEDLGDESGIHQEKISLIESGRLRPTPAQLARLSAVLHLPGDVLRREVRIAREPEEAEACQ